MGAAPQESSLSSAQPSAVWTQQQLERPMFISSLALERKLPEGRRGGAWPIMTSPVTVGQRLAQSCHAGVWAERACRGHAQCPPPAASPNPHPRLTSGLHVPEKGSSENGSQCRAGTQTQLSPSPLAPQRKPGVGWGMRPTARPPSSPPKEAGREGQHCGLHK